MSAGGSKQRKGLSCPAYATVSGDTWQSVATKYHVNPTELMRSNPAVSGAFAVGSKLFVPPCTNGGNPRTLGGVWPG